MTSQGSCVLIASFKLDLPQNNLFTAEGSQEGALTSSIFTTSSKIGIERDQSTLEN